MRNLGEVWVVGFAVRRNFSTMPGTRGDFSRGRFVGGGVLTCLQHAGTVTVDGIYCGVLRVRTRGLSRDPVWESRSVTKASNYCG